MLSRILPLIPAGIHSQLQAGPWDGDTWCLLVRNSASAARLRQLDPLMRTQLLNGGWKVNAIRIKIQAVGR